MNPRRSFLLLDHLKREADACRSVTEQELFAQSSHITRLGMRWDLVGLELKSLVDSSCDIQAVYEEPGLVKRLLEFFGLIEAGHRPTVLRKITYWSITSHGKRALVVREFN